MPWNLVDKHKFLAAYLRYNAGNESPAIYHLWSAITGISAALGRKAYIRDGNGKIFPNLYTLLVGPPATRKSSAIGELRDLLQEATRVRMAPTDISGQKQGLLSFLAEDYISDDDAENSARAKSRTSIDTMASMSWLDDELDILSPLDRSSVFVCASELMSFAGQNSAPLIAALTDLYDGLPQYEYRLKRSAIIIDKPMLQLLAGATPSHLVKAFPPETNDQGLLSRIILVWAAEPRAKIPRKTAGDADDRSYITDVFHRCFAIPETVITEDVEAAKAVDEIYMNDAAKSRIIDPRLLYYVNRRHGVLRKLCAILAMADDRTNISLFDVQLAEAILSFTEDGMPDALGEYGISGDARVRQLVVEYLRSQPHYVAFGELFKQMSHVCPKRSDFSRILQDLVDAGKLVTATDQYDKLTNGAVVMYGSPEAFNDPERRAALLAQLRSNMVTH